MGASVRQDRELGFKGVGLVFLGVFSDLHDLCEGAGEFRAELALVIHPDRLEDGLVH
ncbi:MAG TPA: hypothetical protein VHT29_15060 [Solirubrobacteraceae bacterium]|nr:hypothetical protein [Solirubrobacteraceae bacterium]